MQEGVRCGLLSIMSLALFCYFCAVTYHMLKCRCLKISPDATCDGIAGSYQCYIQTHYICRVHNRELLVLLLHIVVANSWFSGPVTFQAMQQLHYVAITFTWSAVGLLRLQHYIIDVTSCIALLISVYLSVYKMRGIKTSQETKVNSQNIYTHASLFTYSN